MGDVVIEVTELQNINSNQSGTSEQYKEELQKDVSELPKVPAPVYRHAAPSAPWPWMNFDIDDSEVRPFPPGIPGDAEWSRYPQSLFGNWTRDQVERCKMLEECDKVTETCSVHKVDVFRDGKFDRTENDYTIEVSDSTMYWEHMSQDVGDRFLPRETDLRLGFQQQPPENIRVRCLFVENMTRPVLQILGTKYNVEPFFFASSVNWIPSRYQEDPKDAEDHITVVLPFIRTMKNQKQIERAEPITATGMVRLLDQRRPYRDEKQIIDTQAPLLLPNNKILLQDLLSIHMYRTAKTSTIISYHPSGELQRTSAKRLRALAQRTGDSVYWSKIFARSKDPTFLFLAILWYALYAWDEAFEVLYRYINVLESDVLKRDDIELTRELHKLQAHLLYYQQLLRDFKKSVDFVKTTPNPAMSVLSPDEREREDSKLLLSKEADNLISEIDRLGGQREMLSDRLQNVMHLAFATVNIRDSRSMQELAKTTMIDSAAMKQIAYLTMIFLPASYLSNVFSMNVKEINHGTLETLDHYVEASIGLTVFTTWLVIAIQTDSIFHQRESGVVRRALWPVACVYDMIMAGLKWIFLRKRTHSTDPAR